MDLLGDLGATDQLTAARSENAILQARVRELSAQVKILTVEKAALQAEVEMYREEAALPNFSQMALGNGGTAAAAAAAAESKMDVDSPTARSSSAAFVRSGNGVYCQNPDLVLRQLHGTSNPLTVSMSPDETVLVSGGADGSVHLVRWGAVGGGQSRAVQMATNDNDNDSNSRHACRVTDFAAPVICVAASSRNNLVAAGGMDGSLSLLTYRVTAGGALEAEKVSNLSALQPHKKYVKRVVWSPNGTFLATASADGNIHVYEVQAAADGASAIRVSHLQSLHLSGPVECLAFASDTRLLAYARGTAMLTEFDLADDCAVSETNLNTNHTHAVNGGFEEHVSFCCLDMQVSPCRKFLALATDNHRHMILDLETKQQVRNLYGHAADSFSSPVIAWSCSGQYLYCNDQHASALTVYDISSSQIVRTLEQPHARPIKALWSSRQTNTLVTTSFDRDTVVWFAPAE